MSIYEIIVWFVGLLVWTAAVHYVIKFLNRRLKIYIGLEGEELDSPKLTVTVGVIERSIYSLFVVGGKECYTYIGILFGFKLAQRLITFSKIENSNQLKNAGERINVYFICNILSLVFGILGGCIILYFLGFDLYR